MRIPAISVLIDTYNHEKYIEQAVVSAVEQDFPASELEILVVDDGSTDRTPEIVRKFAPRVRLLRKKNGGQASAFNAALPELNGNVVALLDGDDWFAPRKLTLTMEALEKNPEAAAVGHGYYEYHEDTNESKLCRPGREMMLSLSTAESAREAMTRGWPFLLIGALTVRKKVLERVVPIPERLRFLADGPIAWTSMAMGTVVFDEPLCYYRHHGSNLHAIKEDNGNGMRRKFEMGDLMFESIEPTLVGLGISKDALDASLYAAWVDHNRVSLERYGGGRMRAFRNEMRSFRLEHEHPSVRYRLFKYLVVGAATLVMPAQRFYKMRNWYSRRDLGRLREKLAGRE